MTTSKFLQKAVSLILALCFVLSTAVSAFAKDTVIYGYRVKMSDFDKENTIRTDVSSIELMRVDGYENRWTILVDGNDLTEKSGSSFSITYNGYPLEFTGIGTNNAHVDTSYKPASAVTEYIQGKIVFSVVNNTQTATFTPYEGGQVITKTATLTEGYYDFGSMQFVYNGNSYSFEVKINTANNTVYVTRDGKTYTYPILEGNTVYLEWWVDAQEIQASYLDTNLPMLPFEEAKVHKYTDGQIDSALSNYTITMKNNLTGLTHQANLVTTLTYWARKEGTETHVGDGTYNEYTSGVRVVKQWPELTAEQKTYFGGGKEGDVDYARRPFAVYNKGDTFTGIGKGKKIIYTTGEWSAWSDYIYSSCTTNDNTECQKASYTARERSISTGGWSQYPEYTKSCTPTTGMPTSTGTQVSCTSGYIKRVQRTVTRSDDWNESFATSCTPSFPTSTGTMVQCTEGGKLRKTRTITVGAWDKDGSYVTSCSSSNDTKCASGYSLKQTRTVTPNSWQSSTYSTSCSESGTLKCVDGYYKRVTTSVTIGSETTSYQSTCKVGDFPSSTGSYTSSCNSGYYCKQSCSTPTYTKVSTKTNSCSGTSCGTFSTKNTATTGVTWATAYKYTCGATSKSSDTTKYSTTSASTGKNTTICGSTYPYITGKTKGYYKKTVETETSGVTSCTASSTVTCKKTGCDEWGTCTNTSSCTASANVTKCTARYKVGTKKVTYGSASTDYVTSCTKSNASTGKKVECTSGYYHKYTRTFDYGDWSVGTGTSSCTASTASFSASDTSAKTETKCTSGYYYKTTRNISTGDWTSGYLDYSCSTVTNTITQSTNAGTYYDYSCSSGYVKTTTDITYGSWGTDYVKSCEAVSAQKLVGYERTCEPGYYAKETREVIYGNWSEYNTDSCTPIAPSDGKGKEVTCSGGDKYAKRTRSTGSKDIIIAEKGTKENGGLVPGGYGNRMTAADIYDEANRLGDLAARAESIAQLSEAEMDFEYSKGEWQSANLGWSGNETDRRVDDAARASFNQYLNGERFIPWVFITAHWRATKAGIAYDDPTPVKLSSVPVYKEAPAQNDRASLTAYEMTEDDYDDDPPEVIPPDEPEHIDTKVIYFDYRDPLTNYDPANLPENWKGYEYLIEQIKNSDFSNAKFQVKLSAKDIKAMREWTHTHDKDENCSMLREFAYIFTKTTPEFDYWLKNGGSCRTID